jgi:hypothetical protein
VSNTSHASDIYLVVVDLKLFFSVEKSRNVTNEEVNKTEGLSAVGDENLAAAAAPVDDWEAEAAALLDGGQDREASAAPPAPVPEDKGVAPAEGQESADKTDGEMDRRYVDSLSKG